MKDIQRHSTSVQKNTVKDAIDITEKIILKYPIESLKTFWENLLNKIYDQKRWELLKTKAKEACSIFTDWHLPYCYQGVADFEIFGRSGGEEFFDKALELNPLHDLSLFYKGRNYHYFEKYAEAIDSFNRAITIQSNNPKYYFY